MDSTSGGFASLKGGAMVSDGKLVLNPYRGHSYLEFPTSLFSNAAVAVTLEMWIDVSSASQFEISLATFPFRGQWINCTCTSPFAGENMHIVIVLKWMSNSQLETIAYTNGDVDDRIQLAWVSTTSKLTGILGSGALNNYALNAMIDEFRVYWGEMSEQEVYNNFIIGNNPSHITIGGKDTMTDLDVTYYSTTLQNIKVGAFGGDSTPIYMFGPETTFLIESTDVQCNYSVNAHINADGSGFRKPMAAMNYTVTIKSSLSNAQMPKYDTLACVASGCICDPSKVPLKYFRDANLLSQTINIVEANNSDYIVNFTYHSGLCFDSTATGSFPTTINVDNCYPETITVLNQSDPYYVTFFLFERYPLDNSFNPGTPIRYPWFEHVIPNSVLIFDDEVSKVMQLVVPYLSTVRINQEFVVPSGYTYIINATTPRSYAPFVYEYSVKAEHYGLDGKSTLQLAWLIPVLGVAANKFPSFYPVSTDPNLIFLVLRDPPGGKSFTTIHAGEKTEHYESCVNS